jgi:hypothetical protein
MILPDDQAEKRTEGRLAEAAWLPKIHNELPHRWDRWTAFSL